MEWEVTMKANKIVTTATSRLFAFRGSRCDFTRVALSTLRDEVDRMSHDQRPLSLEQFECLKRCARGLSIRFESWETITALVDGGYAERGLAGVITTTVKGLQYLRELNCE